MLTQNTLSQKRRSRLRWIVALSSLPLLGVVTAFGISPQTDYASASLKLVMEPVALPAEDKNAGVIRANPGTATFWRNAYTHRGDTVAELLHRMGVNDSDASGYLRSSQAAASLRQLRAGKAVQAETDAEGKLLALRYIDNNNNQIVIERSGDSFNASRLPAQLEQRMFVRTGEIGSTLFAATDEAGVPDAIANQMVELFSGDIDFHRDLRKGDKFTIIYEMAYSNGEMVQAGRIHAAEFINQGQSYHAVYYKGEFNRGDYYTPEGKSVRKAFLRSPLEFSRVSSGFSMSRLHPILGTWRSHKGVDYAAPVGTKVRATADGIVSFVGKQGGYGNVVMINHQGRYTTVYGHLSRFAAGMHRGQRVAQGDTIGYVGKTGLASGPHLHYEFKIAGQHRDPLRVALPDAKPIPKAYLAEFQEAVREPMERLGLLRSVNLAGLD